jgi:NADP-dependent 3-hydroxy acid dehydrogenase YdfG
LVALALGINKMSDDRVVVITGASSGIGRCCAEYLVQKGFRVYAASRKTVSTAGEKRSSSAAKEGFTVPPFQIHNRQNFSGRLAKNYQLITSY